MNGKLRFSFSGAFRIASQIVTVLAPVCEQIAIAGSLRRCEKTVGDIEIVYVPKFGPGTRDGELLESTIDLSLAKIWDLINAGLLVRRQNCNGADTFGPRNKLMRHISGIPVDLFATDQRSWWNYLVCRTGPAKFNIAIAQRAREMGWKWHPYDCGFSRTRPGSTVAEWHVIQSEEKLFDFLGWPYCEPSKRQLVGKTGVEALLVEPATR